MQDSGNHANMKMNAQMTDYVFSRNEQQKVE